MNRYILIGAGGTGSHFIGPALAFLKQFHINSGQTWEFIIVDGDNFTAANLERQMFDPQYVGANKAEALAKTFDYYPTKYINKFLGKDDLPDLITDGTVVFIGVDNYSLRALITEHAQQLDNVVIINAGNEKHDGSVQLWVRENGENKTPKITFAHPEIIYKSADDRSAMTCAQAAELPGGEQFIIANMAAAQHMLTALWRFHTGKFKEAGWTELQFDLLAGTVDHIDLRTIPNWMN